MPKVIAMIGKTVKLIRRVLLIMFTLPTLTEYAYAGFRETSETTEFDLDFSAALKQVEVVIVGN